MITSLLAGASGTDLAAYASNEIKYNFLTNSQRTALGKEQADVLDKLVRCQNGGQCSDEEILGLLEKIQDLYAEGAQESIDNINKLVSSCSDNVSSPTCQSLRKELDDSIEAGVTDPRLMGIKSSNNTILYDPDIDLDQMLQEIDVGKRPSSDLKKYFTPDVLEKEYKRIYESNEYVQTMRSTIAGLVLALRGGRTSGKNKSNLPDKLTPEQQKFITDAKHISTAKPGQVTTPRNLQEQMLWDTVVKNPKAGRKLKNMNNDSRFPADAGFQKMEFTTVSQNGHRTTIHYQYNRFTNQAYDIKITTQP